tara:strand:+ start:16 stop:1179 length:1164 start_codon:yes stop_codon:yes gene_type:complete
MKKILGIVVLGLLWCNVGIAAENAEELNKNCIKQGTTEFNKKVKQRVKKNFVTVMYFGCKSMATWIWYEETSKDLDTSHQVAYKKCLKGASEYKIETCHLFSINDKIVYGKDAAFVKKIEKDIKTKFSKNFIGTKTKYWSDNNSFVYNNNIFSHDVIVTKSSPTTFKKLIFNKEKNFGNVYKRVKHSSGWKNKKTFRSFSFTAEYEDNIKVELLVEYDEDFKDFKKAEVKALYYSNMYGQMPHFLKTYNKKIYIHNDIAQGQGFGTWWREFKNREFHVNPQKCIYAGRYYSNCALIMAHELAHVIQELTGVISPSKWVKARKLDNKKYCSEYGKTNSYEDFADSMVCWIVVRHLSDRIDKSYVEAINQYIPNRLKFFDELKFNMYPL